ncbi:MAG: nitroreductase family deazaflavin-dependent oxidoreductase [Anaerolineales bacterium]|nr:nitroreductase family deazaflavin-dependent oxidoreductase [Anaerolineales bacterium]
MGIILPQETDRIRWFFKRFNRMMVMMWRLGLGTWINFWPRVSGQIMVLTHTGRRSGRTYRTPVNFAEIGGLLYCTAGFGSRSDWALNIGANPEVEVWLPGGWWKAIAEPAEKDPDRLVLLRRVLIASGFAAYAAGIDPVRMDDQNLAQAVCDYPLFRIRRTEACTGTGGPGDLAWIWPLTSIALLFVLICKPRRRC